MISVCVAAYRPHGPPNLATLGASLRGALAGEPGELVVALNGIDRQSAAAPAQARIVDLGVNRGVAPAWNAAGAAASGDLLVFCNDDVALGEGALARLSRVLQMRPDAGVVGPVGSRWDLREGRHVDWVLPGESAGLEIVPCDVVSGFLFACRRRIWEQVGRFDEFYAPASWEEVDFCTAVRAAGARCYAITGVDCRHEWGVSKRQMPWARAHWDGRSETWRSIHRRNRRHFLEKWSAAPIAAAADTALPV